MSGVETTSLSMALSVSSSSDWLEAEVTGKASVALIGSGFGAEKLEFLVLIGAGALSRDL